MSVKCPILQKEKLVCSIQVKNLVFLKSIVLAELGNKTLEHTFDVLNPKILVTKLDFIF